MAQGAAGSGGAAAAAAPAAPTPACASCKSKVIPPQNIDAVAYAALVHAWHDQRSLLLTGAGITIALTGDSDLNWPGFVTKLGASMRESGFLTKEEHAEFTKLTQKEEELQAKNTNNMTELRVRSWRTTHDWILILELSNL